MTPGDTFTHNGVSFTVDTVFANGKVKASTAENRTPKILVIHPDNITP
jgi:hypothetical protein